MLGPGDKIPDFKLVTIDKGEMTQEALAGRRSVLCFFPFTFSPVCSDQLDQYQQVIDEFKRHDVDVYGISVDGRWSQKAFAEQRNLTDIELLSDFEPKGAVASAFGVYNQYGFNDRAVFIVEPDGTISWAKKMDHIGVFPPADEIFDALSTKAS